MSGIAETMKMKGHLKIRLNGEVVRDIPNVVVETGKDWVAERMGNTTQPNRMSHMAVGTGTTAAASGDAALGTQKGTRVTLTQSVVTSGADSKVSYSATFPSGATTHDGALTEAGIFNAASSGTMLCRTVFSAVNKTENDSLTIDWDVSIS